MRWVIHAGTTKTGSKAIQRFLANERDPRICFPIQGREGNWHRPLYRALLEENGDQLSAALAAKLSGEQNIGVFSYEEIYCLPPRSIRIIRQELGDVKIILFIRRQDSAMNSRLNQNAKSHRRMFEDIVRFEREIDQYNPHYDYWDILSRWECVFGFDAITPIIYDKRTNVIRLFCETLGIEFPKVWDTLPNPNPALSRRAYNAFRSAKAMVSDASELPTLVARLHDSFASEMVDTFPQDGAELLDNEARRRIMLNYEASNDRVRRHWFPDRPGLFDC